MKKVLRILSGLAVVVGCSKDVSTGRRGPLAGAEAPEANAGASGSVGNPGGTGGAAGMISTEINALSVRVEDIDGLEIELVTLRCAGACADIEAIARGGHAPYRFIWDDGSTDTKRTVCLDASAVLEVSVTDTAFTADEFSYEARTVAKKVSAEVLDCSDGGTPPPDAGDCRPVEYDEEGIVLGEVTPDINSNEAVYFADGEDFPPGAYSITYVDGCLRYDPLIYNWAVNGFDTFRYWVIGVRGVSDGDPNLAAPVADNLAGAATYDECVALSLADPPLHFEHAGGPLGMFNNDFKPDDNTPGEGRDPTFRLARHICAAPEDI